MVQALSKSRPVLAGAGLFYDLFAAKRILKK